MKLGDEYLEKIRKRQKQYYVKVSALSNAVAGKRRVEIRERVKKHRERVKERNVADAPDALMVAMEFPKKGESSRRKRKHGNDRFYKNIAQPEREKRNLIRANARLRKCKERAKKASTSFTTITSRSNACSLMKQNGISPSKAPKIKKKLLYAEDISSKIWKSIQERKNKRESIRRVISG